MLIKVPYHRGETWVNSDHIVRLDPVVDHDDDSKLWTEIVTSDGKSDIVPAHPSTVAMIIRGTS